MARSEDLSALAQLLGRLFAVGELRRFAAMLPSYDTYKHDLPDTPAPPAEVTFALVEALDRRGLLNAEFFDLLRAQRPHAADEIDPVVARLPRRSVGTALDRSVGTASAVLTIVVLVSLALLLRVWTSTVPPEDVPPPDTHEPATLVGPPRPAAPAPVPLFEADDRSSVCIACDNQIEAPGGNVNLVGIQEGSRPAKAPPDPRATATPRDEPVEVAPANTSARWTVTRVGSLREGDGKRISLAGPELPAAGLLRLHTPVADGRRFVDEDVACRIECGSPPWCMLVAIPGNPGLRVGDVLALGPHGS